jgi:hypothetical protein
MSSPFSENPYQSPQSSCDPSPHDPLPSDPFAPASSRYCTEAIAALVCAIIGFVPCLLCILLEPIAMVLSISALRRMRREPNLKGHGMAIAGMIISVVGLLLLGVYLLIALH